MGTAIIKAMNAQELTKKLLNSEELFILDVRNTTEFNNWKIEGGKTEIVNIPYFDLLDGIEPALNQIPNDKNILVVCAKEGSSIFIAEQLIEAGRTSIHYLEGGMKAWSEHLEPIKVGDLRDGGEIFQFVRIGKGCLSYMIVSNGEAAMIDTLRMTAVFNQFAKDKGVQIKHTLDTHLHADHISGGRLLAEMTHATYWLPPKDADEVSFEYEALEEGKQIIVGDTKILIQPIYSPGHTIGSTSLIVDDQYLLSGDILFVESIGRPDLAGKAEDWVADLRTTLYETYKNLSQNLIVLPAHFGKVTELGEGGKVAARLGDLFTSNAGLNIDSDDEFRAAVTHNLPPQPNAYQEIRQTNMGRITPSEAEQREMEMGPNRCAVHDK
ncbi:Glyoxylase, beta-lactamase superfamily II [Paenibacillus algorifonticola]|uniref:Glyoxylase, beta-lactamase superfamily II n=1 Tax=Paenibacillus algorifonticola TaxID=684063 RepID=A0A1I1YS07_9BACL|nr:MBL fold metallo-hydrolase [Paenibacillus algorifonticola]SFE22261.1 Glyoxylase, beta-lactamase superfamily II [Paenibacillus algorifonticola]